MCDLSASFLIFIRKLIIMRKINGLNDLGQLKTGGLVSILNINNDQFFNK